MSPCDGDGDYDDDGDDDDDDVVFFTSHYCNDDFEHDVDDDHHIRCPSKPTRENENDDVLESHLMGLFGRHDFVKVVEERDIASCLC